MNTNTDLSGPVPLSRFLPEYLRASFLAGTPVPPGELAQVSCLGSEPGPVIDYEVLEGLVSRPAAELPPHMLRRIFELSDARRSFAQVQQQVGPAVRALEVATATAQSLGEAERALKRGGSDKRRVAQLAKGQVEVVREKERALKMRQRAFELVSGALEARKQYFGRPMPADLFSTAKAAATAEVAFPEGDVLPPTAAVEETAVAFPEGEILPSAVAATTADETSGGEWAQDEPTKVEPSAKRELAQDESTTVEPPVKRRKAHSPRSAPLSLPSAPSAPASPWGLSPIDEGERQGAVGVDADTQTVDGAGRRIAIAPAIIRRTRRTRRLQREELSRARRGIRVLLEEAQALQGLLIQERAQRRELQFSLDALAAQFEQLRLENQQLAHQQMLSAAQPGSWERGVEEPRQMEVDEEEVVEEEMADEEEDSAGEGEEAMEAMEAITSPHPSVEMGVGDDDEEAAGHEAQAPQAPWHPDSLAAETPVESIEGPDSAADTDHESDDDNKRGDDNEAKDRWLPAETTETTDDREPTGGDLRDQSEDSPHGSRQQEGEPANEQDEPANEQDEPANEQDEPANEDPRPGDDFDDHYEPEGSGWDGDALEQWDVNSLGSQQPESEGEKADGEDWEAEGEEEEEEEEPRGRGRESAPSPPAMDSAEGETPGRFAGEDERASGDNEHAMTAVEDPVADPTDDLFAGFASLSLRAPASGPSPEFSSWLEGVIREGVIRESSG